VHQINRAASGRPEDDNGGRGEGGVWGVVRHMTDEPHGYDEFSYGKLPQTVTTPLPTNYFGNRGEHRLDRGK